MRTPLAALRLELEALELEHPDSPELTQAIAQGARVESTIAPLLAVACDAQRPEEHVDLARFIDDAEARWREVVAKDARLLPSRTTTRRPVARASRRVVDEILDVLVDNAHVHGAGEVTVTLRELDGWLAVDVADQGPGFRGDPQRALSEPRATKSHGIGLTLARTLADAEGGRLVVTSSGPAPVLTLLLPAAPA